MLSNMACTWPPRRSVSAGAPPRYGHVSTRGHHLKQLAGNVLRGPVAGRCHIDLPGIGLGVSDEFGNSRGRNRWVHLHHIGHAHDARDRRDVADEVEIKLVVKRRIDGVRRAHQEQRVAVRCRLHDRLGGDIGAGAGSVLDDERLAELLRQPLTHQAREGVGGAARRKPDDQPHRSWRVRLAAVSRSAGSGRGDNARPAAEAPHSKSDAAEQT